MTFFFLSLFLIPLIVSSQDKEEELVCNGRTLSSNERSIITRFQKYLQIETVSDSADYGASSAYIRGEMQRMGLEVTVIEAVPGKPNVIGKWTGRDDSLKSVCFGSHMDVVAANTDLEKWVKPPFSAEIDEKGDIYARGSQDMKSIGMAYLEAVDYLKNIEGFKPLRSIYIIFTVDEEHGSVDGMEAIADSDFYEKMNPGVHFDEGKPTISPNVLDVSIGEKGIFWIVFEANGPGGHGSMLVEDTAAVKMIRFMSFLDGLREESILKVSNGAHPGEVTSYNVDAVEFGIPTSGEQAKSKMVFNIIPKKAHMWLDMRVPPTVELSEVEAMLDSWTDEFGISYEFSQLCPVNTISSTSSPFYVAFKDAVQERGIEIFTQYFMGGTDARFARRKGVPAFGFSPLFRTQFRLHDLNEYLNIDVYLEAIEVYKDIIKRVSNVE